MHSCVTADKPIPLAAVLKSQKDEERMVTFHPVPERSSPQGITARRLPCVRVRAHVRGGGRCAAPGLLLGPTSSAKHIKGQQHTSQRDKELVTNAAEDKE